MEGKLCDSVDAFDNLSLDDGILREPGVEEHNLNS